MVFRHEQIIKKEGVFRFEGDQTASAHSVLISDVLDGIWYNYTYHQSHIFMQETDRFTFQIGYAEAPKLEDASYAIRVMPDGLCVVAGDERNLIYGFLTLLDMICMSEDGQSLQIDCCELLESPGVKNRMVHFCVFPDTELWELAKFVRLCGVLKYSHLILEFWGMLRYDCLRELAWEHAFTKEQIREICREANAMGLEIIPMFNHWGHAAGSRSMHGKHVLLDQNPTLQYLLDDTGWCWKIESETVRQLFSEIRAELMEVCGSGEYFHIGCDEADGFGFSDEEMEQVCSFLNGIAEDLAAHGRKTIMWGDMFLHKHEAYNPQNAYFAPSPSSRCETFMQERLNHDIIIADWQYFVRHPPVETALTLQRNGFRVLLAPWDRSVECAKACMQTVKEHELFGYLHTTWHTLTSGMPYVGGVAVAAWSECEVKKDLYGTAVAMRKANFVDGNYERAGWSKYEIGVITV